MEEEDEGGGFTSASFPGVWIDNLGHQIVVMASDTGPRRKKFLAVMQKPGLPEKRFNVTWDQGQREWRCGNGNLDRTKSDANRIVWQTADGRASSWSRELPDGPVYFDAPPPEGSVALVPCAEPMPPWCQPQPSMYVVFQEGGGMATPLLEWKELHLPADDDGNGAAELGAADSAGAGVRCNSGSPPEEVDAASAPVDSSIRTSAPVSGPQLEIDEESPDIVIGGGALEWRLPEKWGKLRRFPKDFCVTSPPFGLRPRAPDACMQLVFYPGGSKAAESGRCTVALLRGGPDGHAGVKFDISVNRRGSGAKVCLGRRFLGDYPRPFDDSDDTSAEQVVVRIQMLEVLAGGPIEG